LGRQLAPEIVGKAFEGEHELKAFLYVARSDDSGRPLADYDRLVETLKMKSPRGFRWFSQPFPDETHMGMPLLAQVDALRHLYDGYRWHDTDDKGLAFAEQRFRELSEKVGWPIPIPESVLNSLGYAALSANKTPDAIALFARNVKETPVPPVPTTACQRDMRRLECGKRQPRHPIKPRPWRISMTIRTGVTSWSKRGSGMIG
jgi:hypothetical protein